MILLTVIVLGAPLLVWVASLVTAICLHHTAPRTARLLIGFLCGLAAVMLAETFFERDTITLQMMRQPQAPWTFAIRLIWLGLLIAALRSAHGLDRARWFGYVALCGFVLWQIMSFTIMPLPSDFN